MFSPLHDQPQHIYTVRGPAGYGLLDLERQLPGVLAYGHFHQNRTWHRLKKEAEEDGDADLDIFDYYNCYVPLNCAWLFEHRLHDLPAGTEWEVRASINVADIFAWPSDHPEDLTQMAVYGREITQRLVDDGEVRPFVVDLLTDYQARGVYWASTRPWFKLVYACGAGKTLPAILSSLIRPGPVCVLAPAKAQRVWWDQVQEYTHVVPYRVIPAGQTRRGDQPMDEYLKGREVAGARKFVVFRSQSLPDYMERVLDLEPTALIFDELHTFGQPKRWKPIYGRMGQVTFEKRRTVTDIRETRAVAAMDVSRMPSLKLRVGMTATPLDDGRPRRLWSQLDLLSPGGFGMGFRSFGYRYCAGAEGDFGGFDDKGSSNIPELKARSAYLMQEVTHTESHGQLPSTRTQVVWLEPSDQNRPAAFKRVIAKAEKEALKSGDAFDKERALEANLMEAASRKRSYVVEEALEGLRGGGKVVLFTARRQDCEDWAAYIHKALKKEVAKGNFDGELPQLDWGHGGIDERVREGMVEGFKGHPGPCILVATGQAFGESVDGLQTASLAIFAMLPWRPGDFDQWRGRFDRIGGCATLLKVILAKMTYDEKVAGILADKMGPIKEYLEAEQYQGLDNKLLGLDDRDKMRASILTSLFGGKK